MTGLTPLPFGLLVTRMFREFEECHSIFDLPARSFVRGNPARDVSVKVHGKRAATPFGPAAGPHTQLAQNIVLSWLAGGRVIELKTVQIKDDLVIPRPCIDMATVGYNVEWSQELKLAESLEEYVKAAMLIEMLKASGVIDLAPGFGDTVFDMSVGYDLAGIRSDKVQTFIHGLLDASAVIAKLRAEIPAALARYRDLDYPARLSDTLTLSTFHGCPPDEIEAIADFLMRQNGLHTVVKLNPTLLGAETISEILRQRLGYTELEVPAEAFAKDTRWDQAVGFAERLGRTAEALGLGFGVKLTNTLIVRNHRSFFPASEREMYLSGAPLHVLAIQLVRRFRQHFGDRFPISFSAGIDGRNFADAAALGLVPVTVCSDLLKPGGYARPIRYFQELWRRMEAVEAADLDSYALRVCGKDGGDVAGARLANTEAYADAVLDEPRYRQAANAKPPRRVGTHLDLFDCLSCDKCIPVCPNDANFTFVLPAEEVPILRLKRSGTGWSTASDKNLIVAKPHQIGNIADLCNDCGNCDVFCPEEGGPYRVKPRFFVSAERWRHDTGKDGVHLAGDVALGRFEGAEYRLDIGPTTRFAGPGFDVRFDPADPAATLTGEISGDELDLTWYLILDRLRRGALAGGRVHYLNADETA